MTKTIDALVEALETITLACHLDALTPGKGTHVDESVLRVADEALAQASAEQAEPVVHADHCGIFDERNGCTCAPPDAPVANPEPSPTAGMNVAQRILHVGGRNNAAGYVEFGSIQAVEALIHHALRDAKPATQ